jgi:hypothetical protein
MNIQVVKISDIKSNPNNPRVIKDDKFHKLCESIKAFPKMLELRPIVVNDDMIVLGGNMRLKALRHLGLKEAPIIKASDLTDDQQRQFIIKDNAGFGEWDWNMLANEWDVEELAEWGVDAVFSGSQLNDMNENDLDLMEEFDPIGTSKGLQRVVFIFDGPDEAESFLNHIDVKFEKRNMAWQVNLSTQSI